MTAPEFHMTQREESPERRASESKAAFNKALRLGSPGRLNENERKHVKWDFEEQIETKALYASDGSTGGFLTVPEYVNDLIKAIVLISPIRSICDVRETSNPYISIPKRTQTATAYRTAEQATRTEGQTPRFGLVNVFPYEAAALALISRQDLDDASLDLGQFIIDEFAEQFSKLEGSEFVNGTGNNQAAGFLTDAGVTAANNVTQTAAVGVVDYAALVKLIRSLKPGYLQGSSWVFTNETLGVLQSMTDNQGRPLWAPFGTVIPSTLFGYNYVIAPDMPQVATGAYAMAFGNFKRGYQVVIRKQVSIQVLQERFADQNAVGYLGYYRFGGMVKLAEAIKLLKIK